jgi:putative transposase
MRYIELNPVRANIVSNPARYRWSSFAANALGMADPLVTAHPTYLALRATAKERCAAYRRQCGHALETDTLTDIRAALNSGRPTPRIRITSTGSSIVSGPARRTPTCPDTSA